MGIEKSMTRAEHIEYLITLDPELEQDRRDFFETLERAGYIIPDNQERKMVRKGFLCAVSFANELGEALNPIKIYASAETLREKETCVDACGITEVEIREIREIKINDSTVNS